MAYTITGHYDQALQDYNDAIDTIKVDPTLFFEVGNIYASIRDFNNALEAYGRAIDLKPSFVEALINRCYLHNLKMESDAAIEDCQKVIKLDPNRIQAVNGDDGKIE